MQQLLRFLPFVALARAAAPAILLHNAAAPNTWMPVAGAGSGGYSNVNFSNSYGTYPECYDGCADAECVLPDPPGFSSCGGYVEAAISTWLQLGGRRVDSSASYHNQLYTGIAMAASGVPRAELFLTSKVGPFLALGGAEAEQQFAHTLRVVNTSYVDLLLIHWPTCASGGGCAGTPTTEPACQAGAAGYDERACRLATWRALVAIWGRGGARAIGVSNYNQTHLQEIMDAGLPLPAVNQVPFNLYHSGDLRNGLFDFMREHNVSVCGGGPPPAFERTPA